MNSAVFKWLPIFKQQMNKTFIKILFFVTFQFPSFYIFASNHKGISDSIRNNFITEIQLSAHDSLQLLTAHCNFGEFLDEGGFTEEAIIHFEIAKRLANNTKNLSKHADIANYLAILYADMSDYEKSIETYKEGLESAELINDYNTMAKISMNLASTYSFAGNYSNAIEYALQSLKLKETHNITERICYHYITMGNIFRENKNIPKWKEYVNKAYQMKDIEGCASFSDIAKIYNSLGGIAHEENISEKALLYYDTLLTLSKKEGYNQGISTALTNMSQIHLQLGNYQKALELINQSKTYSENDSYELLFNNNLKAEILKKTGKFKTALELVKKNIQTKDIEFHSTEKIKSLELLYELNYLLGNYREAFRWNDTLRNNERRMRYQEERKTIEEMELKYETEKKETKINLLKANNKIQAQKMQIGYAIIIILVVIIFLILYIHYIKREQARLIKTDLQQKILRTQMKPHFIFNALGSIQSFMLNNEPSKASAYLSQLASLMRSTLEYSDSDTISIEKETQMLRNYIELEQMRKPGKFNYSLQIFEIDDPDFVFIPPMLIQPFVENAIKHGFSNITYTGNLDIQIKGIKEQWIEFIIEDNGIGYQHHNNKSGIKHTSKAMKIFEQRRSLIQQIHGKTFNYKLTNIKDEEPQKSGVRIEISIPLIHQLKTKT